MLEQLALNSVLESEDFVAIVLKSVYLEVLTCCGKKHNGNYSDPILFSLSGTRGVENTSRLMKYVQKNYSQSLVFLCKWLQS